MSFILDVGLGDGAPKALGGATDLELKDLLHRTLRADQGGRADLNFRTGPAGKRGSPKIW